MESKKSRWLARQQWAYLHAITLGLTHACPVCRGLKCFRNGQPCATCKGTGKRVQR